VAADPHVVVPHCWPVEPSVSQYETTSSYAVEQSEHVLHEYS
jgi:hypothetical protein